MDVIIDANIIRRDLMLIDKNFEILVDYLNKTNSRLIYPSIVIEEVKGLYKRALKERQAEYTKSFKKFESTLLSVELPRIPEITIEEETEKYIDYIHNKLGTNGDNIVQYKNEFLPELVNRAIERKKPLDNKGQQFRDGLLWLTLLDYASNVPEKRVAFISDNPTDFADTKENKLNSELQDEIDSKGIIVMFFRTLSDFAKEHASVIGFIDNDWIQQNVESDIIEKLFVENLDSAQEEWILDEIKLDSNESTTGYLHRTNHINSNLVDFFVYEKSDGTIIINAEYNFETEYEVEIHKFIERETSRYDYKYSVNPRTGEPDIDMVFIPDYSIEEKFDYKFEYPSFRGKYVLTIIDKKITDYELKGWDRG